MKFSEAVIGEYYQVTSPNYFPPFYLIIEFKGICESTNIPLRTNFINVYTNKYYNNADYCSEIDKYELHVANDKEIAHLKACIRANNWIEMRYNDLVNNEYSIF